MCEGHERRRDSNNVTICEIQQYINVASHEIRLLSLLSRMPPGCFLPEAQKALFSFSSLTVIRTDMYVEQGDMLYKPCLSVNKQDINVFDYIKV